MNTKSQAWEALKAQLWHDSEMTASEAAQFIKEYKQS